MSITTLYGKMVAMVGAGAIMMRRFSGTVDVPAFGSAPDIPDAEVQSVMTLKMPNAVGWKEGHVPDSAPGLKVNAFATELRHPRWIYVPVSYTHLTLPTTPYV